ncbi:DbpA RNA binding domain-containing protein (plasmid) [Jannaschia sp. M317]|nr:DbpA RNA binding domain-containing protein [Jannaschia sp. M317]UWQ19963.1 DbpA RNA binding domain-containing protein [Jannaschia sp. M317]
MTATWNRAACCDAVQGRRRDRDDIGAIRIRDTASFVQIKEGSADAFLAAVGDSFEDV